jgi:hypothetical protein
LATFVALPCEATRIARRAWLYSEPHAGEKKFATREGSSGFFALEVAASKMRSPDVDDRSPAEALSFPALEETAPAERAAYLKEVGGK